MKFTIILSQLVVTTAFAAGSPTTDQPEAGAGKEWRSNHHYLTSLVRQAGRQPALDVYFLGDSITAYWPEAGRNVWRAEFGSRRVLNAGVSGDTTQNIIYRITHGEFDHISPKVVVVLAGINNLGRFPQLQPAELARGLRRIVDVLRARSPTSKILLLSIFPAAEPTDPIRGRIRETNRLLASFADNVAVFYLDLHDAFLDTDGKLSPALSPDGLHLNANGYQVWADAMRPTLQKLLE